MTNDFATICMGIPTINQKELLERALGIYKDTFWGRHIWIVDNGNQNIQKFSSSQRTMVMKKNIGVAASWNLICRMAFSNGYTHLLMVNDDVVYEKFADNLEDMVDNVGAGLFIGYQNWSVFILSHETYKLVGEFDENFKGAYFEDSDYLYRCKMANVVVEQTEILNPEEYQQSASIKKDPSLNSHFESNKQYYISKWGGVPTEEKFTTPFNN